MDRKEGRLENMVKMFECMCVCENECFTHSLIVFDGIFPTIIHNSQSRSSGSVFSSAEQSRHDRSGGILSSSCTMAKTQ